MRDLSVTVAEFEPDAPAAAPRRRPAQPRTQAAKSVLGITATELTDAQKRELRVRVACAWRRSRARLHVPVCVKATVILALGNTDITDIKQFSSVAAELEKAGKNVSALVRRGDGASWIVIRPSK